MPAETHQHCDNVSAGDISDLLAAVIGVADVDGAGSVALADLGADDDLVLLDLWDVAVEEYGERTLGEADLDELRSIGTLQELCDLIAERCRVGGDDSTPTAGDP